MGLTSAESDDEAHLFQDRKKITKKKKKRAADSDGAPVSKETGEGKRKRRKFSLRNRSKNGQDEVQQAVISRSKSDVGRHDNLSENSKMKKRRIFSRNKDRRSLREEHGDQVVEEEEPISCDEAPVTGFCEGGKLTENSDKKVKKSFFRRSSKRKTLEKISTNEQNDEKPISCDEAPPNDPGEDIKKVKKAFFKRSKSSSKRQSLLEQISVEEKNYPVLEKDEPSSCDEATPTKLDDELVESREKKVKKAFFRRSKSSSKRQSLLEQIGTEETENKEEEKEKNVSCDEDGDENKPVENREKKKKKFFFRRSKASSKQESSSLEDVAHRKAEDDQISDEEISRIFSDKKSKMKKAKNSKHQENAPEKDLDSELVGDEVSSDKEDSTTKNSVKKSKKQKSRKSRYRALSLQSEDEHVIEDFRNGSASVEHDDRDANAEMKVDGDSVFAEDTPVSSTSTTENQNGAVMSGETSGKKPKKRFSRRNKKYRNLSANSDDNQVEENTAVEPSVPSRITKKSKNKKSKKLKNEEPENQFAPEPWSEPIKLVYSDEDSTQHTEEVEVVLAEPTPAPEKETRMNKIKRIFSRRKRREVVEDKPKEVAPQPVDHLHDKLHLMSFEEDCPLPVEEEVPPQVEEEENKPVTFDVEEKPSLPTPPKEPRKQRLRRFFSRKSKRQQKQISSPNKSPKTPKARSDKIHLLVELVDEDEPKRHDEDTPLPSQSIAVHECDCADADASGDQNDPTCKCAKKNSRQKKVVGRWSKGGVFTWKIFRVATSNSWWSINHNLVRSTVAATHSTG